MRASPAKPLWGSWFSMLRQTYCPNTATIKPAPPSCLFLYSQTQLGLWLKTHPQSCFQKPGQVWASVEAFWKHLPDARAPQPSDLLLGFPPVDAAAALLKGECVGSFVTWCFEKQRLETQTLTDRGGADTGTGRPRRRSWLLDGRNRQPRSPNLRDCAGSEKANPRATCTERPHTWCQKRVCPHVPTASREGCGSSARRREELAGTTVVVRPFLFYRFLSV